MSVLDNEVGRTVVGAGACLFVIHLFWPAPFAVVVEGAILGSLLGLSALGMGLVYRTNRVVNFAQADLGVIPATVFLTLVTAKFWTYGRALAGALACALVLGFVVERVIIRWFARAPRLMLTVATLGLAQLLAGAGPSVPAYLRFIKPDYSYLPRSPEGNASYPPPFTAHIKVGPMIFNGGDVMALTSVAVVVVALVAFLRFTTTGLALRASAENTDRASLLGIPVPRLHSLVWMLATSLSALSLILRGSIFGLPEHTMLGPAFLLRTLAAAVIGRLENFFTMFVAAIGVGVLELSIFWHQGSSMLVEPLLAVVIIGALIVQHWRRRPDGSSSWRQGPLLRPVPRELRHLPIVRWTPVALGVVAAVAVLGLPVVLNAGQLFLATTMLLLALTAVSLVILTGWAGEISLGQMAFATMGSVTAAILSAKHHLEPTFTVASAAALGAATGAVIGIIAIRVRGMFLAVLTLACGVITSKYLLNGNYFPSLYYLPVHVARPGFLGVLSLNSDRAFYYFCVALVGLVLWWASRLRRTRTARVLVAVRENARSAAAFGIDVNRSRVVAFALSGAVASMGGALLVMLIFSIPYELLDPQESIRLLTGVVVGGLSSLPGAFLGVAFLKSTQWFSKVVPVGFRSQFTSAGTGGGLLLVLMLMPGGLASFLNRGRDALFRIIARHHGIRVPALVGQSLERQGIARRASRATHLARGLIPLRLLDGMSSFSVRVPESGLQIRSLVTGYGPVQVLFGVDLEVGEGETVTLLGTNGSGKSTVLRAVSGLLPAKGTIRFDGTNLALLAPHQIARRGVIQVPSGNGVFTSLTVGDNLRLAGWLHQWDSVESARRLRAVLDLFPELSPRLRDRAGDLSGGQQQMLKLAMAFCGRPRVLLVDELSLGLAPTVVDRLLAAIQRLREEEGVAVVIVEQSLDVALAAADNACFLDRGEVRYIGPAASLRDRPDIMRSVFLNGAASIDRVASAAGAVPRHDDGRDLLSARSLTKSFGAVTVLDNVSVRVHPLEVLGIVGPNGAGKTTLFDILSGATVPDSGRVVFDGRDITDAAPHARAHLGLGRSFQDAALFGALTVHQTVVLACGRLRRGERGAGERADEVIELLGLSDFRDKFVAELSTGTRRVVDLACQLVFEPKVVLLDEPSAGIAQREIEALAPLLVRVRDETTAALVIVDHDMGLIRAVCDHVVALHLGKQIAEGDPESVLRHPEVLASYLGTRTPLAAPNGTHPRSRQALYAEAKRLNIPGRSRMDKAQLEDAISSRSD